MVYIQNFELGVPEEIIVIGTLLLSNVLNIDYCSVSYFGACEKEFIPNVFLSYNFTT